MQLPAADGHPDVLRYFGKDLHVLTGKAIYRFGGAEKPARLAETEQLFGSAADVVVTAFSVDGNASSVACLAGGKPRALVCDGGKCNVLEGVICAAVCDGQAITYALKTNQLQCAAAGQVRSLQMPEEKDVVKFLVPVRRFGLVCAVTSQLNVYFVELSVFTVVASVKVAGQVVFAGMSGDDTIVYVQSDQRVFTLQMNPDLLASAVQQRLRPAEQYRHFLSTALYGGLIPFRQVYGSYLDECFQNGRYDAVAGVVADYLRLDAANHSLLRNQQLVDKITLSGDRKAFPLYAAALSQTHGIRLNLAETLALIRSLHQENVLVAGLTKFIERDLIDFVPGEEAPGNLILELAGHPVGMEYSKLALLCFQKYSCSRRVLRFFLKNQSFKTAIQYAERQGVTDFDFVAALGDKYGDRLEALTGDALYHAQQDSAELLSSGVIGNEDKERLVLDVMLKLQMGKQAIKYLSQRVVQDGGGEQQELLAKTLIAALTAENAAATKVSLVKALQSQLRGVSIQRLLDFLDSDYVAGDGMADLRICLAALAGADTVELGAPFRIGDADAFRRMLDECPPPTGELAERVAGLVHPDSDAETVLSAACVAQAAAARDAGVAERLLRDGALDPRVRLELVAACGLDDAGNAAFLVQLLVLDEDYQPAPRL